MSGQPSGEKRNLALHITAVIGMLLAAALLGIWLGDLSVSDVGLPPGQPARGGGRVGPKGLENAAYIDPAAPPVYFYVNAGEGPAWDVAAAEIAMAAESGLHQYIVSIDAPWSGEAGLTPVTDLLDRLVAADPQASCLLRVNLNPPEDWLRANLDHAAKIAGQTKRYPTPASTTWLAAATNALVVLAENIEKSEWKFRVAGYVLCALQDGEWKRPGYDESNASLDGFRAWLKVRYGEDGALRKAWAQEAVTLDTAAMPAPVDIEDTQHVFFDLPAMMPHVDFLEYTSKSTADAITALCVELKKASAGRAIKVFAPYGYSLELMRNSAGHLALGAIIGSDLNGFLGPVSYADRGLGGAGAVMGPVTSVLFHEKQWLLVDDTRTGVTRDPDTGVLERMKGLRSEDVFNVQRRNFATALIQGLGLIWADPEGQGWLHDDQQWEQFGQMRTAYAGILEREAAAPQDPDQPPPPDEDPAAGKPPFTHSLPLAIVVDETSRFYQRCDDKLNSVILEGARNVAVRSGMATRYCLLQDILEDRIAPAPAYLFLNCFRMTPDERARLHEILGREQAAAIWLYAPGYLDENTASADNITETVRMHVQAFEKPTQAGSTFELPGPWVQQSEPFGSAVEWGPLFYIDDPDVDILAKYAATKQPSIAVRFLEEGWTSVYVAEPGLSPPVLREILRILEQPMYLRENSANFFDAVQVGRGMLAIHANETGERSVDLGAYYDLQDLFDPQIGWPQQHTFIMPINTGETRLLQLTPNPPPEAPVEPGAEDTGTETSADEVSEEAQPEETQPEEPAPESPTR